MAPGEVNPQTNSAHGRAQAAKMGGHSHKEFHSGCPALVSQRGDHAGKIPRVPRQTADQGCKEETTSEGGVRQALPGLPVQHMSAPEDPRHRWDQHAALLPVLFQPREPPFPRIHRPSATSGVTRHEHTIDATAGSS